jgi:hypothetical protein
MPLSIKKLSCYHHAGTKGKIRYSFYSFLTSAVDKVSGQSHAPATLYLRGNDSQYPLDRRLGGPQSRSGHGGLKENPCFSQGSNSSRAVCRQTLY